jgi:RNA polymerase sigma-70 factor (ECF subfamily)
MLTEQDRNGEQGGPRRREPSFERLYREHRAAIFTYAAYRDPGRAEDVVAETFAIAWRRFDDLPADALPWLYGVARRVVAGNWRQSARHHALTNRIANEPPPTGPASDPVLIRALGELDESDRELILLVFWHDLDPGRCADSLGIARATFATRLWRAKRRLRTILDRLEADDA